MARRPAHSLQVRTREIVVACFIAARRDFITFFHAVLFTSAMAATPMTSSVESTPEGTAATVESAAETARAKAAAKRTSAIPAKRPVRARAMEPRGIRGSAVPAEGASTWRRPVRRCMDLGAVSRHGSIIESEGRAGAG